MTKIQKTAQRVVSLIFKRMKKKDLFDNKGNLRKGLIKVGVESHRFYSDQPTSYNVYVRVDAHAPVRNKVRIYTREYMWTIGSWERWGGLENQTQTQAKKGALAWARKLAGEITSDLHSGRFLLLRWGEADGAVKVLKAIRRT